MIKLLILFAIVILSAALGIALSNEKKREKRILTQFYEFNEKLILNMKYGKEKVKTIAEEYEYVQKALSGKEVLKGEAGEFLKNYISGIGQTDASSQIDYLNERKVALNKYKQISEENCAKYGSLYIKICLLVGILVAVLLA